MCLQCLFDVGLEINRNPIIENPRMIVRREARRAMTRKVSINIVINVDLSMQRMKAGVCAATISEI
jgi:hypothetical protein